MKTVYKDKKIPQVFILDASAGTGKTYNLSLRYLYYIFNPTEELPTDLPFKNVLAITFTNKAAKEMKLRIIEFLKKICLDMFKDEEKEYILKTINIYSEVEKQKKSENFLELLFKNYQYFQVRTIDSFINNLITNCALLLNISPNFEIKKEVPEYIEYCVNLLLDKAKEDNKLRNVFKNFIYNFLFIEEKKSWFPENYILKISRLLYSSTRTYGLEFKKVDLQKIHKERIQLNEEIIKSFYKFCSLLDENVYQRFVSSVKKFIDKSKQKNFILSSEDFTESFLEQEKIPVKKNCSVSEEAENLWKDIRKKIFNLIRYEIYHTYDSYIEIFNYLEEEIKIIAKQKNVIFLEELNNLLNKIISQEILPEIYLRLSTRIYHYLIDEFQDTNVLQWKNLHPLIHESISSKGTLFIVGDKKQSIYRFRGGKPELFDEVETYYFKGYHCERSYLVKNYRSKKNIVEFNNNIFSQENIDRFCKCIEKIKYDEEIISEIKNVYSNAKQEYKDDNLGGYVYGELVEISKEKEYEDEIKPKLKELIERIISQGHNYSDICILLRTNSEVRTITEWLIQENIPVESEQTLDIRYNKLIKEIFSLLKFLINPEDNLSFCSFILGEIFLKSSSIEKEKIQNFIFLYTKNNKNSSPIYKWFQIEFASVWEKYFSLLFKIINSLPLYDVILKIYSIFNVLENFSNNYGFFMLLLELVYKIEQEISGSVENFINYFENPPETEVENFYVKVKKSNSVKITTIHKSKGLEYNIVILPLLNIEIEVGKQKDFNSKFIIKENKDMFLEIIKVKSDFEVLDDAKNIYNEEFKKLLIDELNAVYVAFTRAKEKLYFFVPKKENSNKNLAADLIPWNEEKKFVYGKEENKINNVDNVKQENVKKISIGKYEDWIQKVLDEESLPKRQDVVFREEIIKGDVLHRILSYINNLSNKDFSFELESAIEKTKIFYPYVTFWVELKELLYKFISDEKIKPYFFVSQGEVYCEKEIVFNGKTFRVDRLVILKDLVYVLDYKLSSNINDDILQEYIEQVKKYKDILKDIYKDKEIKGFLLFLDNFRILEIK